MILYEEMFEQTEGLGVLELRGGILELVLYLNDKPLFYDAIDRAGGGQRFIVSLPPTQNLREQTQVEMPASNSFAVESPLHEQIAPLLQLLPNRPYRLTLEYITMPQILQWEDQEEIVVSYSPYGQSYKLVKTLVATQPNALLSDERINFYLRQLESNVRPPLIVLSAKGQDTSFLIDGHHKLMAYLSCGVIPCVLRIEFQWMRMISSFFAHQALEEVEWFEIPRYLRHKKWSNC